MVQDEMGPVAGANVVVKGTTNGNISDMDGKVVLQNVPNNSTLEEFYKLKYCSTVVYMVPRA